MDESHNEHRISEDAMLSATATPVHHSRSGTDDTGSPVEGVDASSTSATRRPSASRASGVVSSASMLESLPTRPWQRPGFGCTLCAMATPAQRLPRYGHHAQRAPDWAGSRHVYRPRRPTTTPLYAVVQRHLETFLAQASESDPLGYGVPSWVEWRSPDLVDR